MSEITDSGYGSEIWDQNSTATNGRDHKQESVIKPHKCYFLNENIKITRIWGV